MPAIFKAFTPWIFKAGRLNLENLLANLHHYINDIFVLFFVFLLKMA